MVLSTWQWAFFSRIDWISLIFQTMWTLYKETLKKNPLRSEKISRKMFISRNSTDTRIWKHIRFDVFGGNVYSQTYTKKTDSKSCTYN